MDDSSEKQRLFQVLPSIDGLATPHQKSFTEVTKTAAAEQVMLEVAKACARTAVDLIADPELLNAAWDELRRRQITENMLTDDLEST